MPISFSCGIQTNVVYSQPTSHILNEGRMIASGRGIAVRELVHDFDSSGLRDIALRVVNFFAHRIADIVMFFRALISISGATQPADIEERINRLTLLRTLALYDPNSVNASISISSAFNALSPDIQKLLYYAEPSYVSRITSTSDPEVHSGVRAEIVRECDMAIHFQRILTAINTFYVVFKSAQKEPSSVVTVTSMTIVAPTTLSGGHTRSVNVPRIPLGVDGVDLNIPGTVPYDSNNIPVDVQTKANQIIALKLQYDLLGAAAPAFPRYMECPMLLENMSIPVFDASHPAIQNALRAVNVPGVPTDVLSSYDFRHHLDSTQLEAYLVTSGYPRCPTCRHPSSGLIRRSNLLIDTRLQDEILDFLTRTVNPPITAATTI